MKTIGIIGGLGPDTTAKFYLGLIAACRARNPEAYPSVVIHSIPHPRAIENAAILRGEEQDMAPYLAYLVESAKLLEKAGADFGVIACNTVHVFIDEIRKSVHMPFLSIIEAAAAQVAEEKKKRIGLLATRYTVSSGMYTREFAKYDSAVVTPDVEDQTALSEIIVRILHGVNTREDKERIISMVKNLEKRGAESLILGCTDLQLVVNEKDFSIPVVDTTESLIKVSTESIFT